MNFENTVFFDIETIPTQDENLILSLADDVRNSYSAPKNKTIASMYYEMGLDDSGLSKNELYQIYNKFMTKKEIEKNYLATSFDGGTGGIICICWLMEDSSGNLKKGSLSRNIGDSEKQLLESFVAKVLNDVEEAASDAWNLPDMDPGFIPKPKPFFVGHNIYEFDLPFLWKRMLINDVSCGFKIPICGFHGKDFFDTRIAWSGKSRNAIKSRSSLDFVAKALNLEGKTEGMSGDKVWTKAREGKIDEIVGYCEQDVLMNYKLFKKLTY